MYPMTDLPSYDKSDLGGHSAWLVLMGNMNYLISRISSLVSETRVPMLFYIRYLEKSEPDKPPPTNQNT